MASSRRRALLRVLELTLLVVGMAALGWYAVARVAAAREQASLSRELTQLSVAASAARERDAVGTTGTGKAEAGRSTRANLWRIDVPRIKLSAVAREGVDTRTLRGAAGHIPGTALPGERGNAAFAAHRDTFFAPLKSVRKGDAVVVTTPGGVFRYAVTGTRIVEPEDVSVLDPTPDMTLTLVTCYPFDYFGSAPQRFIVHATLVR
jgi:sortase A